MKNKYIFVQIRVQCGEYQFEIGSVHEVPAYTNIEEFAIERARTFYGNFAWEEGRDFYFNGGEVATRVYSYKEITKEDYEAYKRITEIF